MNSRQTAIVDRHAGQQVVADELLGEYSGRPAGAKAKVLAVVQADLEALATEGFAVRSRGTAHGGAVVYTFRMGEERLPLTWERHWRLLAQRSPWEYSAELREWYRETRGVNGTAMLLASRDPQVEELRPLCESKKGAVPESEAERMVIWGNALVTAADDYLRQIGESPSALAHRLRRRWAASPCQPRMRQVVAGGQLWTVEAGISEQSAVAAGNGSLSDVSRRVVLWCSLEAGGEAEDGTRPLFLVESNPTLSHGTALAALRVPTPRVGTWSGRMRLEELEGISISVVEEARCCWSWLAAVGHRRIAFLHDSTQPGVPRLEHLPSLRSVYPRKSAAIGSAAVRLASPGQSSGLRTPLVARGLLKPAQAHDRVTGSSWYILWQGELGLHLWERLPGLGSDLERVVRQGRSYIWADGRVLDSNRAVVSASRFTVDADELEPAIGLICEAALRDLTLL
jgi:hypothetical protein